MKRSNLRWMKEATRLALLASVLLFPVASTAAPTDARTALAKRVEMRLEYLEKLLTSSSAERLLAARKEQVHQQARQLLDQARDAYEKGELERAEELAKRGFTTFTEAVKALSAKPAPRAETGVAAEKRRYERLHKTVNDLYLRLVALDPDPDPKRQRLLDTIAHTLSEAERQAGGKHYRRALATLTDVQNAITRALPGSGPAKGGAGPAVSVPAPPSKNSRVTQIAKATPAPAVTTAPPPPAKPAAPSKEQPAESKKTPVKNPAPKHPPQAADPAPRKTAPKPKRESAAPKPARPKATIGPPPPIQTRNGSPQERYQSELRLFIFYEREADTLLDKGKLDGKGNRALAKLIETSRAKADRARGQAIDRNFRTAAKLMGEARREIVEGLKQIGIEVRQGGR